MFMNVALLIILIVDILFLIREYQNKDIRQNKKTITLITVSIVAILIVFILKLFGLS